MPARNGSKTVVYFIRPNFTQNAHLKCVNIVKKKGEKVKQRTSSP